MTLSRFNILIDDSVECLRLSRNGIRSGLFQDILNTGIFSSAQWSSFLHLTERTIQRYKKEKKAFEPIQSERIIEIVKLQRRGKEIFGSSDRFETWINSEVVALGGARPVDLLDNAFGIQMIKNELGRIEHGILA